MYLKIIHKISRRDVRTVALIAITSLVTGCSSDTMRFTDGLFTSSTPSQQAAINRPIEQQAPMQQLPPPVQSGTIESNALPQPQYGTQQPYNQAQAAQYPSPPNVSQSTYKLAAGQVAGAGAPPRNLGVIPESVVRTSSASTTGKSQNYTVQSGDTLSGIAYRYGTNVKTMKNANGLSSGAIRVGQKLIIPNSDSNYAKTDAASAKATVVLAGVSRTQAINTQAAVNEQDSFEHTSRTAQNAVVNKDSAQASQSNMVETVAVRMDNPTMSAPKAAANAPQSTLDHAKQPQAQNTIATKDDSMTKAEQVAVIAPQATGIAQMRWPARGRLLSSFGQREGTTTNDGLDILVPEGTSVKATENGVVIYAGDGLKEFGNTVLIRHENNIVTVYGHNSKILVKRNQQVKRGDEIAKSGMSGNASTPKLHFEVRQNSVPVNPVRFLEN